MKHALAAAALLCVLTVAVASQPKKAPTQSEQSFTPKGSPSPPSANNNITTYYAEHPNDEPPHWYTAFEQPDWWLVLIALVTGGAVAYQAKEMRAATDVMRGQLTATRDTSERQLRAYVVAEAGTIANVADPVPARGVQLAQTDARLIYPWGPVGRIQIKNTGQTPAFAVEHWGAICFREYPLTSSLPPQVDGPRMASILEPGIISTKTFYFGPVLTAEQISSLRAGTGGIYISGEILYRDAFGKQHITRYRLIHHVLGGAIGISTDLSFAEGGNEAD